MIFAGVAAVCAYGFYKVGQANIEKRYTSTYFCTLSWLTVRIVCTENYSENALGLGYIWYRF